MTFADKVKYVKHLFFWLQLCFQAQVKQKIFQQEGIFMPTMIWSTLRLVSWKTYAFQIRKSLKNVCQTQLCRIFLPKKVLWQSKKAISKCTSNYTFQSFSPAVLAQQVFGTPLYKEADIRRDVHFSSLHFSLV